MCADIVDLDARRLPQPEESSAFRDTDLANAVRLAKRYGDRVRYTVELGWLVFDGTRWVADEIALQALAKDTALSIFDEVKTAADRGEMIRHAKRSQQRKAIDNMVALARSEPGIPAALSVFDAGQMLLNVANGTIDLTTGEVRPHRREDFITRLVPIRYAADATSALWRSFLRRVCAGDDDLAAYLQRLVGYLLTGSTREQVLHFFYGLGANGKSVFCEVVAALLGDYAVVCSPELIMLRRHAGIPNDVARLRGARVAMMNETSQGARFDEAKLKDLTGGDSLTARFLHREFFDFVPTHKLIVRGNHKPAITGTDEGIWRRLRLVPFTVSIPTAEQDQMLLAKLTAEVPGILRWAVEGCLAWQSQGLAPPKCVVEASHNYRAEADTLGRFVDEACTRHQLAKVKTSAFFDRYKQYCETAGERWLPARELPNEMQNRGFTYKRGTGGQRLYLGLEFNRTEVSRKTE